MVNMEIIILELYALQSENEGSRTGRRTDSQPEGGTDELKTVYPLTSLQML